MQKKILILMSTYNGEAYIREQIDSILTQSVCRFMRVDILIRDDGSTDNTLHILKTYSQKHENIHIEQGNNIGIIPSFFSLIHHAKGYDYYALSDQDDVWLQDKLEKGITALQTLDMSKPALYASCSLLVDNNMQGKQCTQIDRRGLTFKNVVIQNLMPGHTQIFNQVMADFLNAYTFDYSRIIVHDYWFALIAISFGNIYFDNQYHTHYRQHVSNSIGYGHGAWGWLTQRIIRIKNSAAKDITRQDLYFYELFSFLLNDEQKRILHDLLYSQRNIFTRIKYLIHTKVYRQRKIETSLFYILYLLGGYKIPEVLK